MALELPAELSNYGEFVRFLDIPFYTSGRDKKTQEKYLSEFYEFRRIGTGYIIVKEIKPYIPPISKKYNPRDTSVEIQEQLLHQIAAQKAGIAIKSKYGLVHEVRLTLADSFELVGMAAEGWKDLKEGTALPDLTTVAQRRAYFTHHNACFNKWRNAVGYLEEKGKIKRIEWPVLLEKHLTLKNKPILPRLADETEIGDCWGVNEKAITELQKKYPKLKLSRHSDIWMKFKEKEFEQIQKRLIAEAQEKHAQLHPNYPRAWVGVFKISRFFFTDEMMEKWETFLKPESEIKALKDTLTLKMLDWYQLPSNEDKYESIKLCMISLLGETHE